MVETHSLLILITLTIIKTITLNQAENMAEFEIRRM